ncbi:MAG: hypothetical protein AMXMBFR61_02640 [Fimbriimonadales bacterium]
MAWGPPQGFGMSSEALYRGGVDLRRTAPARSWVCRVRKSGAARVEAERGIEPLPVGALRKGEGVLAGDRSGAARPAARRADRGGEETPSLRFPLPQSLQGEPGAVPIRQLAEW